jgi:hypothetical protein
VFPMVPRMFSLMSMTNFKVRQKYGYELLFIGANQHRSMG